MKKSNYKNKYSKSGKKMLLYGDQVGLAPTTNTMQPMQEYEDPTLNQYSNQKITNNQVQQPQSKQDLGNSIGQYSGYYGLMKGAASAVQSGLPSSQMYNNQNKQYEQVNNSGWSSGANQALNPLHQTVFNDLSKGNYGQAVGDIFTGGILSNYQAHTGTEDFNKDKYTKNAPIVPIDNRIHGDPMSYTKMASGGSIHIKPENKGKFNTTKKAIGKTTEELTHSSNPLTKKRAIFAQNASHWNHKGEGGYTNFNNYNDKTWMNNGGVINNMIQLEGDKHSNISQGINYTPDTKVEAGEGVYTKKDGSKYVFSKELGFADKFDKMKNKYSFRKNDKLTNDLLDKKLNQLEQDQEIFKATQSVKNKYKYGGKMYADEGNLRQEDYYNFGNDYMTSINPNIPVNNTNQDIPTTYAQGSMDNSGVGTYKTPQQSTKNNRFNQQNLSPYLGAGLQAIEPLRYLTKYNKLQTTPNYQPIQQTDYIPEKLNLTQAQANQDLLTRTYQKQAVGLSGGNSATALNNLNELQAENLRSKGNLDAESATQWKNDKNSARQFNIQNKNNLEQFNKQMLHNYQVGLLQDTASQQNADVKAYGQLGDIGAGTIKDTMYYKQQNKDKKMLGNLYKDYTFDQDGNIVYRGSKYKKV